jgi:hypothetical protein
VESALLFAVPHFFTVSRIHLTEKCFGASPRKAAGIPDKRLRANKDVEHRIDSLRSDPAQDVDSLPPHGHAASRDA